MNIIIIIVELVAVYIIIQLAIDRSLNTKLLKENLKVLIEIRELLKNINEK
jgi:hypothetical protein